MTRPFRIVLIKPYQPAVSFSLAPPLGCLYLATALRRRLGDRIVIDVVDARLYTWMPQDLREILAQADLVGISAENMDAAVTHQIATLTKEINPTCITAVGGPYAHRRCVEILTACPELDWAFDGEADRTFPEAVTRHLDDQSLGNDILGLYRREAAHLIQPQQLATDTVQDLDALGFPAWDLADLDAYQDVPNMNQWKRGQRYATIFTSRGCPYKCNYCHDIFGKKFRWRSAEHVVQEMRLLIDTYGVDEIQVVDDIFNLHKPRLRKIVNLLVELYGERPIHMCFPNGLRADILDRDVIADLQRAGTYQITVAVETVTPRLQTLIQKNLDLEKVKGFIDYCHAQGILVKGYFMVGFPTETIRELLSTMWFALRSNLTFAAFFTVTPQPETPLYGLAKQHGPNALATIHEGDYYSKKGWYELTTGFPLRGLILATYLAFFFASPRRVARLIRRVGIARCREGFYQFLTMLTRYDFQRAHVARQTKRRKAQLQKIADQVVAESAA